MNIHKATMPFKNLNQINLKHNYLLGNTIDGHLKLWGHPLLITAQNMIQTIIFLLWSTNYGQQLGDINDGPINFWVYPPSISKAAQNILQTTNSLCSSQAVWLLGITKETNNELSRLSNYSLSIMSRIPWNMFCEPQILTTVGIECVSIM